MNGRFLCFFSMSLVNGSYFGIYCGLNCRLLFIMRQNLFYVNIELFYMWGFEFFWDNEKKVSVGRGGELELGFWKVC